MLRGGRLIVKVDFYIDMRHSTAILALLCVPLMTAGCSRVIVQADNPASVSSDGYRQVFEATVEVLRDQGFTIDRRDYRFGVITTLPVGSPNVFEVWNAQNTTGQQAVESTLASEQRRVKVSITAPGSPGASPGQPGRDDGADGADPGTGYMLEVQVVLERRQIPTRRMAGSARRNVFSNLAAPPKDLVARGVTGNYWEPVGRDPYLEARLIQQITERAGTIR